MTLKRTLTNVAVDQVRSYLRERVEQLKELDLDQDGQKDVDQLNEVLTGVVEKAQVAIESTDFQKLGAGLGQIISGAGMIGASVDSEKVGACAKEVAVGLQQLSKLLQLAIPEVKRRS